MQRRKFIQISSLSALALSLPAAGLTTLITDQKFQQDWAVFTAQQGVSKSPRPVPAQVVENLRKKLPHGVELKHMQATFSYAYRQEQVYCTAFELRTEKTGLNQFLIPFWQLDATAKGITMLTMNGMELASLVAASRQMGSVLLPQPGAVVQPGGVIATNLGDFCPCNRVQQGKLIYEWKLVRKEQNLATGSFQTKEMNRSWFV